jgi:hypothetical protein
MNHQDQPPTLLFVHEWWLELRDDLKLAGALFHCLPDRASPMPSEVERTMFERAEAGLLVALARGALPKTPHQIIYGIWFEPGTGGQPVLGPVLNDEWLAPLRDGVATPDRVGSVQIVRIERTNDDRKTDPELGNV